MIWNVGPTFLSEIRGFHALLVSDDACELVVDDFGDVALEVEVPVVDDDVGCVTDEEDECDEDEEDALVESVVDAVRDVGDAAREVLPVIDRVAK
jgi:hypothetical protein